MQTDAAKGVRQNARFALYKIIAIRNYVGMTHRARRRRIARAPRPWLTREAGECAWPHDGDGAAVRACCNPCGAAAYCPGHKALMRGPTAPSLAETLRDLARFVGEAT
jgi:hypothetical protein